MMVSWAVHVTREVGANESQLSQDESTHCILQGSHLRSEGQAPQIWVSFWLWSFASPSKSLSAWVARHLSGMLATFILPDDNVRGLHVDRARNHRVYRDGQYWCDCNDNLAELELLIDSYRSLLSDCILFTFLLNFIRFFLRIITLLLCHVTLAVRSEWLGRNFWKVLTLPLNIQ